MISKLKEQGLVAFLRSYLSLSEDGHQASLLKLLLSLGFFPVSM